MNFSTKLAWGVLGVGAIAGAWYADEHYTKKEQEEKAASSKALNFETEKVRKITLRNSDGVFSFERKDGVSDWAFVEPAGGPKPDQDAVNNLVAAVQTISVERQLDGTEEAARQSGVGASGAGDAAAKFGLKEPRAQVEVVLDGGATQKVFLGNDVGIGSESGSTFNALSLYAASASRDKVLVVGSSVVSATKKAFGDFRTKVAGDFKSADVKGISVQKRGAPALELQKGEKDWSLTAPAAYLADSNNVGLFLDRWSRLRVETVTEKSALTDEKRIEMGLQDPAALVQVKGDGGATLQSFEVGLTKDGLFVTMADGAVGSVDMNQFADLVPDLKTFRDRRVMRDVTMADVTKIRTTSGKEFHKEGANWYAVGADATATPAPAGAASAGKTSSKDAYDVFSQWEFLVADDIIDNPSERLAEYGLENPISRLSFLFPEGGASPVEIVVGNRVPKNEKLVYVKRVDKPEVYAVETQWLDALGRLDGAAPAGQDPQAKK